MEGFLVLISEKVLAQKKDESLELQPLEVLALELKTVVGVMQPRVTKILRAVPIWVEWDDLDKQHPNAWARYYGGHQLSLLRRGENPLKAQCVEILSLRRIAEVKQPKNKVPHSTILHELAHAVHMQLLGTENPQIRAAYRQAMERRLYDRVENFFGEMSRAYATANEFEYFAELSLSYFGRAKYFPFTPEELKKHDPTGYKLVELTWGKPLKPVIVQSPRLATPSMNTLEQPRTASPNDADRKEQAAAATLSLIQALLREGKTERGRERLQGLVRSYPGTKAAEEARKLLEKLPAPTSPKTAPD